MRFVIVVFACLVLAACTKKNQKVDPDPDEITHSTPASSAPQPESAPEPEPSEQPEPLDFSTPEATVNTFITAGAAKDVDALSMCFSMTVEKEFAGFAAKEATEEDLRLLAEMMSTASVVQTSMKAGGTSAAVEIKMNWEGRTEETINVVKEGEDWKIQGF